MDVFEFIWRDFLKYVDAIQYSLKVYKNNGHFAKTLAVSLTSLMNAWPCHSLIS